MNDKKTLYPLVCFFKYIPFLIIFYFLTFCGNRTAEVETDPLLQLFGINLANEYYSNSCKYPSFVLKKGEPRQMELKLMAEKWFRFSAEGTTPHVYSTNPVSNHSFYIEKAAEAEVTWITSDSCIASPSYTYERTPITAIPTEIKYNLWNSDLIGRPPPADNGYYVKLISGNPNITIRFQ